MVDWAAWKAGFVKKYCNTQWRNKWLRELENNHQRPGETVDAYYARFRRLVKRVNINVNQHKRLFIKGLLPHIHPELYRSVLGRYIYEMSGELYMSSKLI
ncbi:hypothetical protein Glove_272g42 [Diversispora epigaea]|uniref:Retrotransposon gag domain-containing protein n=1 Tax=Diversispora epigaea TaxID=1348612 RepID=A0A397I9A4_9GLOM|nr:hypothetical protein Glove_272g42 [Diversispora epigaea]